TQLFALPFFVRSPRIQLLADGLRTFIEHRFPSTSRRILVCHSLGGLIARRMIVDDRKKERPNGITHLLLLAVPNNGAELASVGRTINWWHPQLRQLCKNSDFLDHLNEDWHRLGLEASLSVTYVVGGNDKVVDEASAKGFWGNDRVKTVISAGHIDIVKPTSHNDLQYLILKQVLQRALEESQATKLSTPSMPKATSPAPTTASTLIQDTKNSRPFVWTSRIIAADTFDVRQLTGGGVRRATVNGSIEEVFF